MIRIAIVGEIGSGKSYISRIFGFPVFNADKEVLKIYSKNKKIFLKLRNSLPNFIKSYPLDKKELLNAIIKNNKNLKIISRIVHPLVRKRMNQFLKKNNKKKAIVLDIPLYFENKIFKEKDFVIYIYAKKIEIIKRLKLRKGFNLKIYKQLKKFQLTNEQKRKRSNFFVKNNFNKKALKKEVNMLKFKIFKNERNNSRYRNHRSKR
tara:strand:+ start:2218 stop:2835 length:618 start_codon:yes stop_codon:yes gene_type:complete